MYLNFRYSMVAIYMPWTVERGSALACKVGLGVGDDIVGIANDVLS
jgi:hypothetical protein